MIITRLKLTNWRNFAEVDVPLRDRAFVIGPNASGKSNLLDAVRFLRDVAKREGGGLQAAVARRGGVAKIRCLSARGNSAIAMETHLSQDADSPAEWVYRLAFSVETSGSRRVLIREETIRRGNETILSRPDQDDEFDSERLTATALEQINVNRPFREVADFFGSVSYLHLVPQLIRHGAEIGGSRLENDPFGQGFLDEMASVNENTRASRLRKIGSALAIIVPHLDKLDFERDQRTGKPHLKAHFDSWRRHGSWMEETELSDGTLRLIGLFWALLENDGLLLLEEPEISLNRDIVLRLPPLIYRLSRPVRRRRGGQRQTEQRQVILTTHSADMLCDYGIDGREILYITPDREGAKITHMAANRAMRKSLEAGVMPGEIAPFRDSAYQIPFDLNLTA